jgi:pentalenolactone synthase
MTAKVCHTTTPAGSPALLVTDYETVRDLLGDPRLGLTHPEPARAGRLSDSVIFGRPQPATPTDAQDHTRMRRLLGQRFSLRRLDRFRPRVRELVDGLLGELASAGQPADFHRIVSFPLPALVICELLGVPYERREEFRQWSDDAADMYDHDRSLAGRTALADYITELVEIRLTDPGEDLLSDLVAAHRAEPAGFGLHKVVELGLTLLFAGHETTVTAIDTGAVLLATHPAQRDKLSADPGLVDDAVEEILRGSVPRMNYFVPPADDDTAGALPRWANTDLEIAGTRVHAGDLVLLGLAHANLDPDVTGGNPGFDVTRTPNKHLTFGHGPHFCAGAPLARLELQVLFGATVRRFPGLTLAVPAEQLQPRTNLLTGGLTAVPVIW